MVNLIAGTKTESALAVCVGLAVTDSGTSQSSIRDNCRSHTRIFIIISSRMTASADTSGDALILEVAQLIVTALNFDIAAADIDPDAPLYGDGLDIDSIDILEIALAVSKKYGFQLRADNEDNVAIYASLRSLAQYIAVHRKQ
jgi:acyl carrier protein